jgi:hypothetical protein
MPVALFTGKAELALAENITKPPTAANASSPFFILSIRSSSSERWRNRR